QQLLWYLGYRTPVVRAERLDVGMDELDHHVASPHSGRCTTGARLWRPDTSGGVTNTSRRVVRPAQPVAPARRRMYRPRGRRSTSVAEVLSAARDPGTATGASR